MRNQIVVTKDSNKHDIIYIYRGRLEVRSTGMIDNILIYVKDDMYTELVKVQNRCTVEIRTVTQLIFCAKDNLNTETGTDNIPQNDSGAAA